MEWFAGEQLFSYRSIIAVWGQSRYHRHRPRAPISVKGGAYGNAPDAVFPGGGKDPQFYASCRGLPRFAASSHHGNQKTRGSARQPIVPPRGPPGRTYRLRKANAAAFEPDRGASDGS